MRKGKLQPWAAVYTVNGVKWQLVNLCTCKVNAQMTAVETLSKVFGKDAVIIHCDTYTQPGLTIGARRLPAID